MTPPLTDWSNHWLFLKLIQLTCFYLVTVSKIILVKQSYSLLDRLPYFTATIFNLLRF